LLTGARLSIRAVADGGTLCHSPVFFSGHMAGASLVLPCLVFALGRESHYFRRHYRPQRPLKDAPCRAWLCGTAGRQVLALETGIGAARTEQALVWLLGQPVIEDERLQPRFVLSAGFCGALQENCHVGEVLLATEAADLEGRGWPVTWPGPALDRPLLRGRVLTVPRLVTTSADKRTLGRDHNAVAVDMETATVARLCTQHNVPFGCVRAVSDDVHTSLSPRLVSLLAGGRVSGWRLLAALALSPRLMGELCRLARQTRLAGARLAEVLEQLLVQSAAEREA
jgi:nucleoside phosphorylase